MRPASLRSISSHSNEPVCDHLILCIHLKLNGPILNHACTLTAFRLRISTRPCPLHASSARAPSHSALLLAVIARHHQRAHMSAKRCHGMHPPTLSSCMAHSQLSLCSLSLWAPQWAPLAAHRSCTDVVTRCCRHALLLSRAVVVIVHAVITWLIRHHMAHSSAHLGLTSSPAGRGVHEALKGRRAHLRFRHEH